jgi:DNA (cytosine-5)-methyltransferase 1
MGSLFDGIGGFPLAAVHNGIVPVWASEIEVFPIGVTKNRFPDMIHVGDIKELNGAELPIVDIICGGSPCQDLSVAGKRAGLQGERSGLFMEQIRIVKEMRDCDKANGRTADDVRPRYMVWENVPGAFSSAGGEDFRAVLEETCRIADSTVSVPRPPRGVWKSAGAILGSEFSIAWRVYDAQYWGVAQRRRRIFLVADFGGHTAPKILFEQDSLFGNYTPGEETRQGTSACTRTGTGNSGGYRTCHGRTEEESLKAGDALRQKINEDGVKPSLCNTEDTGHGYVSVEKNNQSAGQNTIAFACNQRDEVRNLGDVTGAIQAQPGMKQQTFIAETTDITRNMQMQTFVTEPVVCLNDQGGSFMDVSNDVSGTLRASMDNHPPLVLGRQQGGAEICEDLCPTITSPVLFENHGIDSRYTGPYEVAPTMSARYGTGGNNVPLISQPSVFPEKSSDQAYSETYCIAGNIIDRQEHNGGNGMGFQPDISYTLNTADRHCVFSQQRSDEYLQNDVVGTQSARQHKDATDLVYQTDVAGLDCRNGTENGNLSGTLQSKTDGGYSLNNVHPVRIGKLIRRLTPLECERLQGFPDDWTNIPGASDSVRYKALGNSVAIPCVDHVLHGIAYFLYKSI